MAKTLIEAKITTREQRKKLLSRPKPYWRMLDQGVHLGYRKGKRGGSWLVRRYVGNEEYRSNSIGPADDEFNEGTFDYNAAVRRAKEIVEAKRLEERATAEGPALTVRGAVEAYVGTRDARDSRRKGRPVRSDASHRLCRYVTGRSAQGSRNEILRAPLAGIALHDLRESDLAEWCDALPQSLKCTTKDRLINDLKAALNTAYTANRSRLPSTLMATIKHGLQMAAADDDQTESVARENQILTDAQVSRLIEVAGEVDAEKEWDGALHLLVAVLAATGSRMSQVVRLRVADFDVENGRLMVPVSRKGRGKAGRTAIPVAPDLVAALGESIVGKDKGALLLQRPLKRRIAGGIEWERCGVGPWQSPTGLTRPWHLIRNQAEMPEVIPYALRHSSIVRQLRLGLPISVVAKLHDTGVAMIERHYGRFIADALDELVARQVVSLMTAPKSNKDEEPA